MGLSVNQLWVVGLSVYQSLILEGFLYFVNVVSFLLRFCSTVMSSHVILVDFLLVPFHHNSLSLLAF